LGRVAHAEEVEDGVEVIVGAEGCEIGNRISADKVKACQPMRHVHWPGRVKHQFMVALRRNTAPSLWRSGCWRRGWLYGYEKSHEFI